MTRPPQGFLGGCACVLVFVIIQYIYSSISNEQYVRAAENIHSRRRLSQFVQSDENSNQSEETLQSQGQVTSEWESEEDLTQDLIAFVNDGDIQPNLLSLNSQTQNQEQQTSELVDSTFQNDFFNESLENQSLSNLPYNPYHYAKIESLQSESKSNIADMLQEFEQEDQDASIKEGEFVQRSGTRFVVRSRKNETECENFYFLGWNSYYFMLRCARKTTRNEVIYLLDEAKKMGLTVVRVWAFSDGPIQWLSAQRYPGLYDEATLIGLDFLLNESSKRGIRVVLAFTNYWSSYGGVDQYNIWSYQMGYGKCNGEFSCRDDFFSDDVATQFYKDHIYMLLNRKNTFNGRLYKEDPAIFGYNLMNEPRSTADLYVVNRKLYNRKDKESYNMTFNNGDTLHRWIEEMATYIKTLDPIHLLTIGEEGFFGQNMPTYMYANPGAWAGLEGSDFIRNHKIQGIDYATMHLYVDLWLCGERGATPEGRMQFYKEWIKAHQEAAEEELQMPLVLEEFGAKLQENQRYDLYKHVFEQQLSSGVRGGSFGGAMFWVLYHPDHYPMDEYDGKYGMYLPPITDKMLRVYEIIIQQVSALRVINRESQGEKTCVWYPPYPYGLGCRHIEVSLQLGGMPWECLPDYNENQECIIQGKKDVYKNPPLEWIGYTDGRDLNFNTIEVLVTGYIQNNAYYPIALKDSYIIIPFSQGVHTTQDGIWERLQEQTDRFNVYCWYASIYQANGNQTSGRSLCDDEAQGITFEMTDFGWPVGTKSDRGLKINFNGNIYLYPGDYIAGNIDKTGVLFSFKDQVYHNRLDVSSLSVQGSKECPFSPRLRNWPPPLPPPPPPCTEGKHPYRACPQLEWYVQHQPTKFLQVESFQLPCEFSDCKFDSNSSSSKVSSLTQQENAEGNPYTLSSPSRRGLKTLSQSYQLQDFVSISEVYDGHQLGLTSEDLRVMTAVVSLYNLHDTYQQGYQSQWSHSATMYNEQGRPLRLQQDLEKITCEVPNPEGRTQTPIKGYEVFLIAEMKIVGGVGKIYRTVAKGILSDDNPKLSLRGVIELEDNVDQVNVYAEVPQKGVSISMLYPQVQIPYEIDIKDSDKYDPCILDPAKSPDAVMVFVAEQTEEWHVQICARGYGQQMYIYEDKTQVAHFGDGLGQWEITNLPVKKNSIYHIILDGPDHGLPFGGFRGGSGLRVRRSSGLPFLGYYDAKPMNSQEFITAEDGKFWKGCQQFAFAGVNAWDMMYLARNEWNHTDVDNQFAKMQEYGIKVARIWGFALEETVTQQQSKELRLQESPGVYNETTFQGLDYVLYSASQHDVRIIITLEGYWQSIDMYIEWINTTSNRNDFFMDYTTRQMYKKHVMKVSQRVNIFTNISYMHDPTIFAWEMMNEPRCTECGTTLQEWIGEMGLFFKAVDPNHMISIGSEGFYSDSCFRTHVNPGQDIWQTGICSSPWAQEQGQDFIRNHETTAIDFVSVHVWADNWYGYADYCGYIDQNKKFNYTYECELWKEKLDYTELWIKSHIEDAQKLGKPLIISEFGKTRSSAKLEESDLLLEGEQAHDGLEVRDKFFQMIYDIIEEDAIGNQGSTQGSNFWNFYADGIGTDDPYYVSSLHDSTMGIVQRHAYSMNQLSVNTNC